MNSLAKPYPPEIHICHGDHEHDRIYTQNLIEYFAGKGWRWRSIQLGEDGLRPELQSSLDEPPTAIIGYNSMLDHSWLPSGNFMEQARRYSIPVLQWILDHPSHRWPEFYSSTSANSRFLLNTEQEQQYFLTYCLPDSLTGTTGGVGPNQGSRIETLTCEAYGRRPIACVVPLGLNRAQSVEQSEGALAALEPSLAEVVREATSAARCDLTGSLQSNLTAALAASGQNVSARMFHRLSQIVEQSVQTFRRREIFGVARQYQVLIQSDESAAPLVGGTASFLANVGMQSTISRMPLCRAVLSVSPMNGMIHDRTMNALNAGCVAIAEDNAAVKGLLEHKRNALLFRYGDDSLRECLDIVCNQPGRAFEIAQAGMKLRDHPRIRFGQFQNIIDLALQSV